MRKIVNIITLSIFLVIIIAWILNFLPIYYLIPVVLIYTIINIIGSSSIANNYFIESINNIITDKKEIAITFDDGPDANITPELLEILNNNNVKATFFCTGEKALKNGDILSRIFENGHIIGNHTYYHSKFFDLFSASRMVNEISFTNNEIYKVTGKTPKLFRPPYGVTNPMLKKALKRTNLVSIGWSLRSLDTVKSKNKVLQKLKSSTKPGDIVLFHDTVPDIVSIVQEYLVWLKENSYKVVSLTKNLNIQEYES